MSSTAKPGRLLVRRHRVRVEFHHVDLMNVVHNAQYFKWFEKGRLSILEAIVPVRWGIAHRIATPVVKNHCEYLTPATYGDELVITTRHRVLPRWTGTFTFEHSISDTRTKREICNGWGEVTVIDHTTNRILKELPDDIWRRYQALPARG